MAPVSERLLAALGSSYTIERELTGGGMARVFAAEDSELGRKVVIKILDRDLEDEIAGCYRGVGVTDGFYAEY